ncbi:MAG: patatin-like phospholipase family protein [Terracidiphilus sp.]
MAKFRVLSLDGGGSWALIEVRALIDLYGGTTTGHEVLSDFDLAVGNSGGSIVLGGLVENMTLNNLLGFFQSEQTRKSVFKENAFHLPGIDKYDTAQKLTGLTAALPTRGCRLMPDAASGILSKATGKPVHLLIIGFDHDKRCSRFFRSAPAGGPAWGDGDAANVKIVEAIHASSNAPIEFFDKPAQFPSEPGKRYWDGAISGCNNPVLAGVVEAVVLGQKPESIVALSLGTGTVCLPSLTPGAPKSPIFANPDTPGLLHDVKEISSAIIDDPPDAATFVAHVLTGGSPGLPAPVDSHVVRMSPLVSPVLDANNNWTLPDGMDAAAFNAIANLAMDAVAQEDVEKIENLTSLWLQDKVRNQGVRVNGKLYAEVGQDAYSRAKAAWLAVR